MTMQKARIPGTMKHAITAICEAIGFDEAASAVGKSVSLVRRWSDPDDEPMPNLEQGIALDMAYVAVHDTEPPILQTWRRTVRPQETVRGECLNEALLNCHTSMSRVNQAIISGTSPTGPGGKRLTAKEAEHALTMLGSLRSELDEMEGRIKRNTPCLREVGKGAA